MAFEGVAFRGGGNQYGKHAIWLDGALRDLEISFMIRPNRLESWTAIIVNGDKRELKHFGSEEDAKGYCEEYLAEELKPEFVPYFG